MKKRKPYLTLCVGHKKVDGFYCENKEEIKKFKKLVEEFKKEQHEEILNKLLKEENDRRNNRSS